MIIRFKDTPELPPAPLDPVEEGIIVPVEGK
jgi:hypothetical protein